jgi:hypothetical protein
MATSEVASSLAQYDPQEVLISVRALELLRDTPFKKVLQKYSPKDIMVLITAGESLKSDQRDAALRMFNCNSSDTSAVLARLASLLGENRGEAEELLHVVEAHSLHDIIAGARVIQQQKAYRERNREILKQRNAERMREARTKKKVAASVTS